MADRMRVERTVRSDGSVSEKHYAVTEGIFFDSEEFVREVEVRRDDDSDSDGTAAAAVGLVGLGLLFGLPC